MAELGDRTSQDGTMMEILDSVDPSTPARPRPRRLARCSLLMLSWNLIERPAERVSKLPHA